MTGLDIRDRRVVRRIVLGCCLTMLATCALAQPTAEQQAAIRNACRADFMANCAGVQPGGAEALACLQGNQASLSSDCQSALSAIASPGAPAPPPAAAAPAAAAPPAPPPAVAAPRPTSRQQAAIRSACRSDFMTNCAGVTPGGFEALACLQRNASNLSPACQRAVAAVAGGAGAARSARVPAGAGAPPAAAPPPMPPLPPIAELMIHRRCRVDISTICPLPPGGGRIIECLVANTPSLTPRCQGALAEARAMVR
jgi:hypothetical protein